MSATPDSPAARSVGFHHSWTPEQQAYDGAFEGLSFVFYGQATGDDASIADLAAETTVGYYDRTYDGDDWNGHVDHRAGWHRNTISFETWVRAHAYREARDWREKRLAEWFEQNRHHAREFGFGGDGDGLNAFQADPPSQSRLWEVWNEEFSEVVREACRELAKQFFLTAVENSIPLPAGPFEPENRDIESERGEHRLIAEKAEEVWQQVKPFVTDSFYLKRDDNWSIHENAFWDQHAFMSMRNTMHAHSGQHSFAIDSNRDRTPSGSNHRHQIEKLDVEEIREMLHNATKALVARARHNSKLTGKVNVSIDITKGHPWEGEIERDESGDNIEPWVLGYKNDNSEKTQYYFQWASIQVTGMDVPVILDAVPVRRGKSREDIVRSLLKNALDILPNIDKVSMDKAFEVHGIKTVCEELGVTYLNPKKKTASVRGTCANLKQAGQKSAILEQSRLPNSDVPTRKEVYLPAEDEERFPPADPDEAEDGDRRDDDPEPAPEPSIRQELVEDFAKVAGADEEDEDEMFSDLLDEIHEEEEQQKTRGSDADVDSFAVFETNDPNLDVGGYDSPEERLAHIECAVAPYSHRWGIENGYKKVKKFMTRTKSKNYVYRFFNFAFGCVLYNCWRLVDFLVKLAIEDDPTNTPRVDANQFLTIAKQYYGLDPPD